MIFEAGVKVKGTTCEPSAPLKNEATGWPTPVAIHDDTLAAPDFLQ